MAGNALPYLAIHFMFPKVSQKTREEIAWIKSLSTIWTRRLKQRKTMASIELS